MKRRIIITCLGVLVTAFFFMSTAFAASVVPDVNQHTQDEIVAGFSCKNGTATAGLSAGGNTGMVSDIHLKGYSRKKIDDVSFTSMSVSRDISEGEKIYLGIVNSGSDTLNTSVLDSSGDKEKLKGKNWLFYVEFFSDSLE